MSDRTSLGDRMKSYESKYSHEFFSYIPVMARLDGRAFHSFCKGLKRPFDKRFSDLMVKTTEYLVAETNARCGYTQSDEITLVWINENINSEIFFAGKLQKMNSMLASMASVYFNKNLETFLPEKKDKTPLFDCRVFQVPTDFEAVNCFIWREQDASRNSVMMAAQAVFGHSKCQNKKKSELIDMLLAEKNINWQDYPIFFKRGTYVRRKTVECLFTAKEIELLPEMHKARNNPNLRVKRSIVTAEPLPPLAKIINRREVIFCAAPACESELSSERAEVNVD